MANKKLLNTSQRIMHVFACTGTQVHVHPGFGISKIGKMECPDCGKPVTDITDTLLGQSYFAFARPDFGAPTK